MTSPKTTNRLSNLIMSGAWQVDTLAGGVEAIVLSLTSRAAGWVACVPTILLTSRSCETIFALTPVEALASAVALELVGQSTTKTWLRGREWNRSKRETDPPANAGLALALTIGYFAIDFVLIAILQIPKAQSNPIYYAALLFPLAQVISTIITAERATQFGREAMAKVDREKRREAAVTGKARAAKKREQGKVEQAGREEFATEYHAHRRAPDASTYAVIARDGWKCYYCGVDMSGWPRDEIHVDHFYPVVAGGSDNLFNLVVSCKQCNLSKHTHIPSVSEVHHLKVHLVQTLDIPAREKVWLLQHVDGVMKQKDIASVLGISPSYVSASVREQPDELSEHLTTLCAELCTVGEPSSSLTELKDARDHV